MAYQDFTFIGLSPEEICPQISALMKGKELNPGLEKTSTPLGTQNPFAEQFGTDNVLGEANPKLNYVESETSSMVSTRESYESATSTIRSDCPLIEDEMESPASTSSFFKYLFYVPEDNSRLHECPTLAARCGWLWDALDSPYSIPFWLMLMTLSVSGAVFGGMYAGRCFGAPVLPAMICSVGITLTMAYVLKICFIVFQIGNKNICFRFAWKTVFGLAAVATLGVFAAESVFYWSIKFMPDERDLKRCHPQLVYFAFWWNCFMWLDIVSLFLCPG